MIHKILPPCAGRAADAEAIAELIGPFVQGGKLLPRTATEIRDLIPTGFVAESGGKSSGLRLWRSIRPKLAEIRSLAVGEGQQRIGLGRQLVAACVELARKRNILEVMVVTSSEEFFQSCGFDFTLPGEKKALVYPADGFGRSGFFDNRVAFLIVSSLGKALSR